MISYFKANDPYRLVGIFLLLLVIRLPFLLTDLPLIQPELKWLVIGEKLADGALMYRDVWDYTSPLSAFVYKWLHVVFGRSAVVLQIVSILLVIYQAAIFNNIMLNNKAYNQSTYVPAFIYMIVMNSYFDFMTLSPVLMSMTFNLLAMNNLFKRMDNTTRDELFVNTGFYLGVATLFFLPSILFFLVTLLALLLYTGSIVRRMLLLMFGFGIVLVLSSMFYYWHDGALFYHEYFYRSLLSLATAPYLTIGELLIASIVPLLIFVICMVKIIQEGRYVNFQVKIQYVMFYFMMAGVIAIFMSKERSTYQFIYFIPSLAFFIAHYVLMIKNWVMAEGATALIILALLFNNLILYNGWLYFDRYVSYEALKVQETPYEKLVNGKKLLVVGEELSHYKNAQLATPFLNWNLSARWLEYPNYYDNITMIFDKMEGDLPDVILDQKGVMPEIFDGLPTISSHYETLPNQDNVYIKKD